MRSYLLLVCFFHLTFSAIFAQQPNVAIGQWESFLPYNNSKAIVDSETHIYFATELSVYSIHKTYGSYRFFNKVSGLSDMGISTIAYNQPMKTLIVAYNNGNLDFINNQGKVTNRPAIKQNSTISGSKAIKHIYCDSNLVYLSAEFGLISFDLSLEEFKETVFTPTGIEIAASASLDTRVFISTNIGIFYIDRGLSNFQDFGNWQQMGISDGLGADYFESFAMAVMNNYIYADINDTLMRCNGMSWEHIENAPWFEPSNTSPKLFTGRPKLRMQTSFAGNKLIIATGQSIVEGISSSHLVSEYYFFPDQVGNVNDAISDGSSTWSAGDRGAFKQIADGSAVAVFPEGPNNAFISDMQVDEDGVLWCAGTPKTFNPGQFNANGIYRYKDRSWTNYNKNNYPELEGVYDFIAVAIHPKAPKIYAGTYLSGLVELNTENDSIQIYDANCTDCALGFALGDPSRTRITSLAFDEDNHLWMLNAGAAKPIVVLKEDGSWLSFNASTPDGDLRDLAIDRFGNKWMTQRNNLLVYSSGSDIDDPADDSYLELTSSNSNLASSKVNCVVTDRDGSIWVGTDDGVTIFSCNVFNGNCPGLRPVINPDNFNGRLLEAENIKTMQVDGANRIWIGTDNGIFLLDADSYEEIHYFKEDNSPLFDNSISAVAVDGYSGQVYIAGDKGLQGYKAKATQGVNFMNKSSVLAYPNPFKTAEEAYVSIRGLAEDANVKITDVNGNLVFEQKAYGGQAVWDGNNYLGQKAASGVYLVFLVNDDASQKLATKFVLIR